MYYKFGREKFSPIRSLSLAVHLLEAGSLNVGLLEVQLQEVGSLKVQSLEVGSLKVQSLEVGSLEVQSANWWGWGAMEGGGLIGCDWVGMEAMEVGW